MTNKIHKITDHQTANQAATHLRSVNGAYTSVNGNKCAPEAHSPRPQRVEGPPPFQTPFQDINDELDWDEYMRRGNQWLDMLTRVLMAFVVAGIVTLIIVNVTR